VGEGNELVDIADADADAFAAGEDEPGREVAEVGLQHTLDLETNVPEWVLEV